MSFMKMKSAFILFQSNITINLIYLFYLLRFCGEGDLFDKIQSVGFFNEYSAAFLMKQILSSVNYCHFSNIVHRDIKADNFLIFKTTFIEFCAISSCQRSIITFPLCVWHNYGWKLVLH